MRKKRINLLLLIMFMVLSIRMSADNKSEIYSAYINNRMDLWKTTIDRMEAIETKDNEFRLELINYQYGYIGYCLGFNKEKEAQKYLSLAEENVSVLEKKGHKLHILNAYRSAFYFFRISLNKLSAPFNGPKSLNYARRSVENNADNYFGFVQMGNAYFYMPQAFGGSKKMAFENFDKARRLMENDPVLIKNNWNYLSLLVVIAQSHAYLGENEKAKALYEHILSLEPGFLYVKDDLYPKLILKIKNG